MLCSSQFFSTAVCFKEIFLSLQYLAWTLSNFPTLLIMKPFPLCPLCVLMWLSSHKHLCSRPSLTSEPLYLKVWWTYYITHTDTIPIWRAKHFFVITTVKLILKKIIYIWCYCYLLISMACLKSVVVLFQFVLILFVNYLMKFKAAKCWVEESVRSLSLIFHIILWSICKVRKYKKLIFWSMLVMYKSLWFLTLLTYCTPVILKQMYLKVHPLVLKQSWVNNLLSTFSNCQLKWILLIIVLNLSLNTLCLFISSDINWTI